MSEAYPLSWPPGWPRTPTHELRDGRHQFRRPVAHRASPWWGFVDARDALYDELRRLGAANVIVSSNFRPAANGRPVEPSRRPVDQGIAVYFTVDGKPRVMARDPYLRAEENMRSLALTIEALRAVDRHGGGLMMSRAFEGFVALPPPLLTPVRRPWWHVLDIDQSASEAQIKDAFRRKAKAAHPDNGGSESDMADLNIAYEDAMRAAAA